MARCMGLRIIGASKFALRSIPAEAIDSYSGNGCWERLMILMFKRKQDLGKESAGKSLFAI